ncbi:hypothetical protein Bca101_042350 [Brassica carinata]
MQKKLDMFCKKNGSRQKGSSSIDTKTSPSNDARLTSLKDLVKSFDYNHDGVYYPLNDDMDGLTRRLIQLQQEMSTHACLAALVPSKKQPAIRVKVVRTWMGPFGSIRPNTCLVFGDEKQLCLGVSIALGITLDEGDCFTQVKCVAYGSVAEKLYEHWSSTTANVVVCVLKLWRIEWGNVEVEAMRKLYCRSLPSDHKGTCGKNGIKTCVGSIRKMIETNTGKPLPKDFGIKCDKCTDVDITQWRWKP